MFQIRNPLSIFRSLQSLLTMDNNKQMIIVPIMLELYSPWLYRVAIIRTVDGFNTGLKAVVYLLRQIF